MDHLKTYQSGELKGFLWILPVFSIMKLTGAKG